MYLSNCSAITSKKHTKYTHTFATCVFTLIASTSRISVNTQQDRPLLALLKQHNYATLYYLIYYLVEKTPVRLVINVLISSSK